MAGAKRPEAADDRARGDAPAMLDTREVAAYLRLKERRIYDLVRDGAIPHVRATGKLLFPRQEIDAWLNARNRGVAAPSRARPPIVAGSHDPLLEWSVRESRSGLAILACGSRAGLDALARDEASAALVHWRDDASGEYNVPLVRATLDASDVVVLEWARRAQGLLVPAGNPKHVKTVADIAAKRLRFAARQPGSGSRQLWTHLLASAGLRDEDVPHASRVAHGESEVAALVREGEADAGLGVEAAAHEHGLAFVPVATERVDLVMHRRDAFEPPLQALFAWMRTPAFVAKAKSLRGYDVANASRVVFNG